MVQPDTFHDVVDRLVMLGLKVDTAETYLHLLMQGEIRPGALALVLRVSRAEAYRRLQELAQLDLATASQQRPITYRPAAPAAVFDLLESSVATQADMLHKVRAELQPFLALFSGPDAGTAGQTFRYLVGRRAYDEEVRQMLDEAKEEVLIVNTHPAGPALAYQAGLWTRLRRRADAGIRFRVLLQDTAAVRQHGEAGMVRLLAPGKIMRFLICDRKFLLVCIVNDASDMRDAPLEKYLVTSAPGFIAAHLALFEHLWDQGHDVGSVPETPRHPHAFAASGSTIE